MTDNLLSCPFCGEEAELTCKRSRCGTTLYKYRCSKCHAAIGRWHGGISGHPWTARETWNTRAERMPHTHDELLAEMRAINDELLAEMRAINDEWAQERTCHTISTSVRMLPNETLSYVRFDCCGFETIETRSMSYCPNCGARVVS